MRFPSFYGFHNEVLSARKGHKAGKVRWGRMCNGEGGISIDRAIQTGRPGTDRAQEELQQSDKGVIIPQTWIIPWWKSRGLSQGLWNFSQLWREKNTEEMAENMGFSIHT